MRLVAFSDGHVGEYLEGYADPETGLNTRLLDTLNIWTWVHDLAVAKKADCVVFGGDRFKPKRPPAWMRDLADQRAVLFRESNIPLALLEGNHDQWDKARRWNTYGGFNTWKREKDPLWVFDKPGALDFNGLCLYFLPYGSSSKDIDFSDLNPDGTNILFFHDDVAGVSNYGSFIADHGHSQEGIDRDEFMLALGGHVHLRQELPFKNTSAFHIGSPLERIEDGDQGPKGALVIDVDGTDIGIEFVESPAPKIVQTTAVWNGDIDAVVDAVQNPAGNIAQLVISHTGNVPPGLRREVQRRLRVLGVGSADVRLQAEYTLDVEEAASKELQHAASLPLDAECIEWVRVTQNDPKLTSFMEQVIKRANP